MSQLTILKSTVGDTGNGGGSIRFEELKEWVRSGTILRHMFTYNDVRLLTHRVQTLPKPLATSVLIRLLSRGSCIIEGQDGSRAVVNAATLLRLFGHFTRDWLRKRRLLAVVDAEIRSGQGSTEMRHGARFDRASSALYLRTDLVFGLLSGGSVSHIAGVLNEIGAFTGQPIFLTTDGIPTVQPDIETYVVEQESGFGDFAELPALAFNATFESRAAAILSGRSLSLVYQRYSAFNYVGARLASRYGLPFVVEYNGSEVWINRNWGRPLKYERLASAIETYVLKAADLVVVVSEPMRAELLAQGIDGDRILVNPNGVDTDRYRPDIDGRDVRERHGLGDRVVVGFIGTFGPWHGAEVLADAFGSLIASRPDRRDGLRLLMIGDGVRLQQVRDRIAAGSVTQETVFVGRTPQADGPTYLAACDILVSPHVSNADGSPFFGSPTKLFEYMAMGRPIVASRLDQIGDVLVDGETALLVPPGDPGALAAAIARLVDDPELRARLGRNARARAVESHTWRAHTKRIVEALEARVSTRPDA